MLTFSRAAAGGAMLSLLMLLCMLPAPASALVATQVTNTNDSGDGSLRDVIANAPLHSTVTFAANLAGQTITLDSPINITTGMEIAGLPDRITVTTNGHGSVFVTSTDMLMHDLNVNNGSAAKGGGIHALSGELNIQNMDISNSHADDSGGGLYAETGSSPILDNVRFIHNDADGDGGGLYLNGSADITTVTLDGNQADARGGGIFINTNASPSMNVMSIENNESQSGGGIYNLGSFGIAYATINGNDATGDGGGIVIADGHSDLRNTTISGNVSQTHGGGVAQIGGELDMFSSTISNNTAPDGGGIWQSQGDLEPVASIVAEQAGGGDCLRISPGVVSSGGYNLVGDGSCFFGAATDIPHGTARLKPLTVTAPGDLATQIPAEGSDALNRLPSGAICASIANDERFVTRPQGLACDLGAFELVPTDATDRVWGDNLCHNMVDVAGAIEGLKFAAGLPWTNGDDCPAIGGGISIQGQFDYGLWADPNCDGVINGLDTLLELAYVAGTGAVEPPNCPAVSQHVDVLG